MNGKDRHAKFSQTLPSPDACHAFGKRFGSGKMIQYKDTYDEDKFMKARSFEIARLIDEMETRLAEKN